MPTTNVTELIATAEQLSPERSPAQAVDLNQRILQLDPTNAAAHVRLARAYQAQRKFAEAKAACQEALRLNPGSTVAKQRLQRITKEWALAQQAQTATSFEEALRRAWSRKTTSKPEWRLRVCGGRWD
jgi:tetratricopeptide (TPR) repeat protein